MTPALRKTVASKNAMRRRLAALPVTEKLRLLDVLRERSIALAEARKRVTKAAKK